MSDYFSESQKELLRNLISLKEQKIGIYPFMLRGSSNKRGFFTLFNVPDFDFDRDDFLALVDAGFLRRHFGSKGQESYSITNDGHYAVKNNFQFPEPSPTIASIGAIFQGDVSGGNFSSVGTANAQVSQIINDPALLKSEIETLIEQIIDKVKLDLRGKDLSTYIQTTEDLKQLLLAKDPPIQSALKKTLGTLSFLGDIQGTMELTGRVWPYLYPLIMLAAAQFSK